MEALLEQGAGMSEDTTCSTFDMEAFTAIQAGGDRAKVWLRSIGGAESGGGLS